MTIRPLFEINEDEPVPPVDAPKIVDRRQEAKRVVKRITSIIDDQASIIDSWASIIDYWASVIDSWASMIDYRTSITNYWAQ